MGWSPEGRWYSEEFELEEPEQPEKPEEFTSDVEIQEYQDALEEYKQELEIYREARREFFEEQRELHNDGNAGGGFNYCRLCAGSGEVKSLYDGDDRECPACFGSGVYMIEPWD